MSHKEKIVSQTDYASLMSEIQTLMKKGEANLSTTDLKKLRLLAKSAEEFEDGHYSLPMPKTIEGMVELKMFQLKLNQAALAEILEISRPKLSQILSGKREPDVVFLKAIHKKLDIDGNFLLSHV